MGFFNNILGKKGKKKGAAEAAPKKDSPSSEHQSKIQKILAEIPILNQLNDAQRTNLASHLKEKSFSAGQNLMKQGDKGQEFFIITSGSCKVVVTADGKDTEIAQLGTGDYCGEQALLHDATRGATVTATETSEVFVLDQATFKKFLESSNVRFAKRDAKRNAVAAEIMDSMKSAVAGGPTEKSGELKEWLLRCVEENILFQNLDESQREVVVDQMYRVACSEGENLIQQGDEGNTFYVVESGSFDITVKGVGKVDSLEAGRCVGELALLYNAPRAASVLATSDGVVWCVDRQAFRRALKEAHESTSAKNIEFLKKCELMQPLLSSELALVDQALETKEFKAGAVVFSIGDEGDRFYLIRSGAVSGVAKDGSEFTLTTGAFFGERALLTNEPRAATITASQDMTCLTLTKSDFDLMLGPLEDIMQRNLEEYEKPEDERQVMGQKPSLNVCGLDEFRTVGILGRGAFGTVKLVVDPKTNSSYALKAIRKNQVVDLGQQAHILNEKRVMEMMDSPFLVNLKGTYKDEFRVYFLLEVCLGGELFTVLRRMRSFDENTARFYAACVVEAFDYMHSRDIIYRDLKPENLVLTDTGYLKVTDFGFAKVVPNKTFTLCGTPDYLAPEIVTGQGHGKGVDWWTLGILIYEMLASFPPFFDDEPMMTYRKIITCKYKFPRYLSQNAKDLISKFLKPKATKRAGVIKGGADLIRKHPWFSGFDWKSFGELKMSPPHAVTVDRPDDLSNFDQFDEQEDDLTYKGDPDLGWDDEF